MVSATYGAERRLPPQPWTMKLSARGNSSRQPGPRGSPTRYGFVLDLCEDVMRWRSAPGVTRSAGGIGPDRRRLEPAGDSKLQRRRLAYGPLGGQGVNDG